MINALLIVTLLAAPTDSAECGSYPAAWVLTAHVTSMLTAGGDEALLRSDHGLAQQSANASRGVVTDPSLCAPLMAYFEAHVAELADSAYLAQYGYHHGVMHFGEYTILLVVPKDPPGEIVPRRAHLIFFDLTGSYVTVVSF